MMMLLKQNDLITNTKQMNYHSDYSKRITFPQRIADTLTTPYTDYKAQCWSATFVRLSVFLKAVNQILFDKCVLLAKSVPTKMYITS